MNVNQVHISLPTEGLIITHDYTKLYSFGSVFVLQNQYRSWNTNQHNKWFSLAKRTFITFRRRKVVRSISTFGRLESLIMKDVHSKVNTFNTKMMLIGTVLSLLVEPNNSTLVPNFGVNKVKLYAQVDGWKQPTFHHEVEKV